MRHDYRSGGALPRAFWSLWAGWLISALATFVFPFLAFFLTARGFSPSSVGLVVSLFGAGSVVAGPFAGVLADRIGRRPVILASLLASAASASVLAFLSSPFAIGAVVLVFGFASQAVKVPFHAIVMDIVAPESRPRAFGLAYWAKNVGASVSLLAGGLLASRGWALPFLADALTTFAFTLVVFWSIGETRPARSGASTKPGYREVWRDGVFVAFLVLYLCFGTALWQLHAGLPIDMARHGVSPAAFGTALAVNTILVTVLQPFVSRVTAAIPPATVLAAGALLVAGGYGGYALCSTAPQYALATAILTLGEIAYLPVAGAFVANLAPVNLRGRYAGAFELCFGLAGFLAPIAGSAIIQAAGAPALWVGCCGMGGVIAAGHLALGWASRSRAPTRTATATVLDGSAREHAQPPSPPLDVTDVEGGG